MNKTSFKTGIAGAVAAALLRAAVARKIAAGAGIAVLAMGAAACANPLESELDDLKSENEKLKAANAALEAAKEELEAAKAQLADAKTAAEREAAELRLEKATLAAQKAELEAEVATLRAEPKAANILEVIEWANSTDRRLRNVNAGTDSATLGATDRRNFIKEAIDFFKANKDASVEEIKDAGNQQFLPLEKIV